MGHNTINAIPCFHRQELGVRLGQRDRPGGVGLALRVLPSGLKTWLWQGRMRAGRVVRLTLGEWGQQGLSVRQARRLAAEVRSRVHAGRLDTGLTATTSEPRCRAF